jgi:hypothetical protein
MQKIKAFLVLALLAFTVLAGRAQGIVLRIDSIVEAGVAHYNNEVPITNNDSITVLAHLINNTNQILTIYPYTFDLGFECTYKGITIDSPYFYWTAVAETLAVGDSVAIRFGIYNGNNNPLPDISPGGGSVVIWPIYNG